MNGESFTAQTTFGKFKVTVSPDITLDLQTRERIQIGYLIKVGGRIPDCVFLKIPLSGEVGDFTRLDSKDGCTVECQIEVRPKGATSFEHLTVLPLNSETRHPVGVFLISAFNGSLDIPPTVGGEKTVAMTRLAMTVAREKNPNLKTLTLDDSATFPCRLPDGKDYAVNSTDYDLFFSQQSYYEKRYGAVLLNETMRGLYESRKPGFVEPEKKPATFDFKEPVLEEQVAPLYAKTTTWKEFADEISATWKGKKCLAVYLWLKSALFTVFDGISFSGQKWIIHLNDTHQIPYTVVAQGGGYTRRRRATVGAQRRMNHSPPPREYLAMDWRL